jgi:hypothetical protein
MQITTNNIPRFTIDGFDLSPNELAEFDYLEDPAASTFIRYKGQLYDLGEFMRVPDGAFGLSNINEGQPVTCWEGYLSDTYFSGVLIRYADSSCESVVVGRYYS